MKRDALVPIGVELAAAINAHATTMTRNGGELLFARGEGAQDPRAALTNGMAAMSLGNGWQTAPFTMNKANPCT